MKYSKKSILYLMLIMVFLMVSLFSAYKIIDIQRGYKDNAQYYDTIRVEQVEKNDVSSSIESENLEDEDKEIKWPDVNFEQLRRVNSDIVAWISIEGTGINYPIVQGEDNFNYLRTRFDKAKSKAGTPFLDARNAPDFSEKNNIVYGHNMKDGSMFSDLVKYQSESYYKKHPVMLLTTPQSKYRVEIFAAYVCDPKEDIWKVEFNSADEYISWIEDSMNKSTFQSGFSPTENDIILTLSTCSYEFENARYVVMGVLRQYS